MHVAGLDDIRVTLPNLAVCARPLNSGKRAVSSSVLTKSSLANKLFATLGEPFSLWEQMDGQWEPTDLASPQHITFGPHLANLPQAQGPRVQPLDGGELLLCLFVPCDGKTLALTGLFPTLEIDRDAGWSPTALQRAAMLAISREHLAHRQSELELEIDEVSKNLASTYEEISLLHGLTRRLGISNSRRDLAEMALDWLHDCLPAEAVFLHYEPTVVSRQDAVVGNGDSLDAVHLVTGVCGMSLQERLHFFNELTPTGEYLRGGSEVGDTRFADVRQYLAVAIQEREHLGWLVAVNHTGNESFSSIEASLLRSVSTILGIHFANRERYEEQANLVADIVRALATSIDAKDPYTRGHSDRVANIAVVLARTLGLDEETLRTMYIGGLLHDIGKIGVDDTVLRKEGRLTDEEFEQIKQHPGLGYQILADLKPLEEVLPIVLHHHERWDGNGYPDQIAGEQIEVTARIAAVADAFDAMTSDRPYRKGMPLEKVEGILRDGAGSQWDAEVIDAFFKARDEIVQYAWKHEHGPAKWSPQPGAAPPE